MIGEYDYDILTRRHRILICDEPGEKNPVAVTMTFTQHDITDNTKPMPVTELYKGEGAEKVLRALAQALQKMGLFPEHPMTGEMSATKFHLEDMRKLYLREISR